MNARLSPDRPAAALAKRGPEHWLAAAPRARGAAVRLFCLPHAGAGASVFRSWPSALPDWIDALPIRLPGRETRFAEPPVESMDELVDLLTQALEPWLDLPYALFGHSMGARVACALAHRLRDGAGGGPVRLFVSGSPGPELRVPVARTDDSDEGVVAWLRQVGGTPPEVLDNAELRELLLPVIRADTEVVRSWPGRTGRPLDCPIRAFAGYGDDYATPERVRAWSRETGSLFAQTDLPGGHLFLREQARAMLRTIAHDLAGDLPDGTGEPRGPHASENPQGTRSVQIPHGLGAGQ